VLASAGTNPPLLAVQDCIREEATVCRWLYERTDQAWLGRLADWLLAKPLKILLILVLAMLLRALLHRAISRLAQRAAEGTVPGVLSRGPSRLIADAPLLSERRQQRAATMASVLKSISTGVILAVAFVMALAEIGLNIAPVIASAGIAGVALGFGAQSLVKDFLSGIFMILEDQYGVGDVVDLGEASGTVESVGLRITRIRDATGVVWYVRNGEVLRVGNRSQGWSTALLDVTVAYDEDVQRVMDLLRTTAEALAADADWTERILETPELAGIESVAGDALTVRLSVKCAPNDHLAVQRELRRRIKDAFDREGIRLPVVVRPWSGAPAAAGPGPGPEPAAKA